MEERTRGAGRHVSGHERVAPKTDAGAVTGAIKAINRGVAKRAVGVVVGDGEDRQGHGGKSRERDGWRVR